MRKLFLFVTATLLTFFARAQFPDMQDDPVMDNAHVLTKPEISALNEKIKAFEEETSMHIKIVTVDDISKNYLTVSDYTKALYHHWQLGDPNKHNGLMIVFGKKIGAASTDMKDYCRIMTGWGTMKILTDDYVIKTVKHQLLMPHLPNDPAQGFNLALDSMFQTIRNWNKDHPHDLTAQTTTGTGTGGALPVSVRTEDVHAQPFTFTSFWAKYHWWILATLLIGGILIFLVSLASTDFDDTHYSASSRKSTPDSPSSNTYRKGSLSSKDTYRGSDTSNNNASTASDNSATVVIFSCSNTNNSLSSTHTTISSCTGGDTGTSDGGDGGSSCGGGGCGGGCGGGGCSG